MLLLICFFPAGFVTFILFTFLEVFCLESCIKYMYQINSHTFSTFFFTELHFLCVASISLFRYSMKTGLMRLECQQIYNTHERSTSQTDHP